MTRKAAIHVFVPERTVHEDRDPNRVHREEEGRINAGERRHRWAELAVVVFEEPQIHVTIERAHSSDTDRRIHRKLQKHD